MSPTCIFGWNPSCPGGDVVNVPPPLASGQFSFQLRNEKKETASSPPPPSSLSILSPTDEKIPRPPNSFIIFRTEFARLHRNRNRGPRVRRDSIKDLTRTVSAKAGDAWRQLSPAEKLHYKRLADIAKEKHAIEYPNYQYRPRRKEPRAPAAPVAPPAPKVCPSRAAAALTIRTACNSSSSATALCPSTTALCPSALSPAEEPPPSPEGEQAAACLRSCTATANFRRRSASVPVTDGEHQLYISIICSLKPECGGKSQDRPAETRWERPAEPKRRSRSVTQEWASLVPSYQIPEPTFFDPRSPQHIAFPSPFYTSAGTFNPAAVFVPPQRMSPLAAVSSSLAGWNGVPTPRTPPPLPPMAPQPLRLNPPPWLGNPDALLGSNEPSAAAPEYAHAAAAPEYTAMAQHDSRIPFADDFSWPLEPPLQYLFDGADEKSSDEPSSPEEYARVEALQEYKFGLQERVYNTGPANDFALFTLDLDLEPGSELQF